MKIGDVIYSGLDGYFLLILDKPKLSKEAFESFSGNNPFVTYEGSVILLAPGHPADYKVRGKTLSWSFSQRRTAANDAFYTKLN